MLVALQLSIAMIFMAAGVSKLLQSTGTRESLKSFGVNESLLSFATVALPLSEIAAALLLIPAATMPFGMALTSLLAALFLGAVAISIRRGKRAICSCFGRLENRPVGLGTLGRNFVVFAMAVAFAVLQIRPDATAVDELSTLRRDGVLLLIVLLGVAVWLAMTFRQDQARLLERIKLLEGGFVPNAARQGLEIGAFAPQFEAPMLGGGVASLGDYLSRGKPLLLVFVSPSCPACQALLPLFRAWEQEQRSFFTLLVVSEGSAEKNRKKFDRFEPNAILIQRNFSVSKAYRIRSLPSGLFIDSTGTVLSRSVDYTGIFSLVFEFTQTHRPDGAGAALAMM